MFNLSLLNQTNVRPIYNVPKAVFTCLLFSLLIQILWHSSRPPIYGNATRLQEAPPIEKLQLFSFGDSIALGKILMLWLQAFDNQPGISIPFNQLDYKRLIGWLDKILLLDEQGLYPLFAASRVYSEVPDETKKKQILEFVYQQFLLDPNHRWPALAHAVYVAKHRLKDLQLALRYAQALARHVSVKNLPYWLKQMEIYILEDLGEIEDARILIGGLLESGGITDKHELMFLKQRLKKLEEQQKSGSSE